ncbi:hypothetical protein [Patulibacter minatonensis]|uniref:hypothetical protein n=1 Tax=Patulibacter minatonensis TaxID=298163 RepID=UPI000479601C|nr:hypothetical protein [Patulibacter minatonensis]
MNSTDLDARRQALEALPGPYLSLHAIDRYRQRIKARARQEEIGAALEACTIQVCPPGWAQQGQEPADGWAVKGPIAFPLVIRDGRLLATTCIQKKRQIPKADRRAYRELIRSGEAA